MKFELLAAIHAVAKGGLQPIPMVAPPRQRARRVLISKVDIATL
jgi:hypothetical protein